uniref:Large ribosomal subunit protein uL10-like insertion domain-containing protein n=1 Tax=Paramoeba aestuarina TaxID=180227 RepID=A0A7S4PJU4_9EUKA|mmetsp:Transcript_7632/g.11498  ORF Transcript_7632/g.11498 Transcript_7632/m.11498 type:complete len:334 (+) Transcript_7632:73-1074(+)
MTNITTERRKIPAKKLAYQERFLSLMKEYKKILLIGADNVGSSHFQSVRASLRGEAIILMGKNTIVRKILHQNQKEFPDHAQMIPKLSGNLGFVFTNGDIQAIRRKILDNKVGAPARVGAIAPCDVSISPGATGLGPELTSFMQACFISTMIVRGQIEVKHKVDLIKKGEKVSPSHAALLTKLKMSPFSYNLTVPYIFDNGAFFDADVLDLSEQDLLRSFSEGIRNVACISLATNYPTLASVPHSICNAHNTIFSISVACSHPYHATKKIIRLLDDPEALQEAIAAASAAEAAEAAAVVAVDDGEGGVDDDCCDCPEDDIFGGPLFGSDEDDY